MDFQDFITEVFGPYRDSNPNQRTGQALFNAVANVRPELANKLQDSGVDPFYLEDNDPEYFSKMANALAWLAENWVTA